MLYAEAKERLTSAITQLYDLVDAEGREILEDVDIPCHCFHLPPNSECFANSVATAKKLYVTSSVNLELQL